MRADLHKLLCEHERYGHTRRFKAVRYARRFTARPGEEEALPQHESMRARYRYARKEFGDNLSPLRGLLQANVGRPWNEFFSELCRRYDRRRTVHRHLFEHLDAFIERDLELRAGELWVRFGGGQSFRLEGSDTLLYVDPVDGRIKRNAAHRNHRPSARVRAKALEAQRKRVFRRVDADNELHLIEGIWYCYTLADIPPGTLTYLKPQNSRQCNVGTVHTPALKRWEELSLPERRRFGTPHVVGGTVRDLLTGHELYREGGRVRVFSAGHGSAAFHGERYRAAKRTASRKLLKKMGLGRTTSPLSLG